MSSAFALTPTAGAADHGRVLLDRCYLEVPPWSSSDSSVGLGWFLRPQDLAAAAEMLRDAGLMSVTRSNTQAMTGPGSTSSRLTI